MPYDSPALRRFDHRSRARVWLAVGAAAVVAYLAIGLYQLDLPGLQYDEAADAVPAIELRHGAPPTSQGTITIFGRELPLMMRSHIGPTSTYWTLLAFTVAGVSVTTLRVSQLLVGAVSLVLCFTLARRWFGARVAAAAVALLATAPPFVWWSRAGINWTLPLVPLALGLLLALTQWWRTRSRRALVVAAGLFGVGLSTKVLFVWLVAPLALWALVVLGPIGIGRAARELGVGTWIGLLAAFVVGFLPMLVFNVLEPNLTLRTILANARQSQLYGHDNLAFWRNLDWMIRELLHTMQGDTGAFPTPSGGGAGGWLLAVSFAVLLVECARGWRRLRAARGAAPSARDDGLRARFLLVLVMVTVLPESTVSTSTINGTYLFVILPLGWLIVAVGLLDLARGVGMAVGGRVARRGALTVAILVIAAAVMQHLALERKIHRHIARTGGDGFWSDGVNRLAVKLESEYRDRIPIAMDWGIERSVTFLTDNRVRMREEFVFSLQPPPDFADHCRALLTEPRHLYAFHPEPWNAFPGRYAILARIAEEQHRPLRLVETIRQRDGHANILLYSAD